MPPPGEKREAKMGQHWPRVFMLEWAMGSSAYGPLLHFASCRWISYLMTVSVERKIQFVDFVFSVSARFIKRTNSRVPWARDDVPLEYWSAVAPILRSISLICCVASSHQYRTEPEISPAFPATLHSPTGCCATPCQGQYQEKCKNSGAYFLWQQYIWMNINPRNTLKMKGQKDNILQMRNNAPCHGSKKFMAKIRCVTTRCRWSI